LSPIHIKILSVSTLRIQSSGPTRMLNTIL
jgi:hypothetical protein